MINKYIIDKYIVDIVKRLLATVLQGKMHCRYFCIEKLEVFSRYALSLAFHTYLDMHSVYDLIFPPRLTWKLTLIYIRSREGETFRLERKLR